MSKQYKSEALAAVHETALGLREAGVMDKTTMKTFDEICLTPEMTNGTDLSTYLDDLKKILNDLCATGDDGFEGLIGTALSQIAGVPFRLAGSGLQFGVDGESTYAEDAISFECKHYKDRVPKNEIMSKIGELSIGGSDIDLWVLCATSQINSQLVGNVCKFGAKHATSTLILDWSEIGLPPLAVALAMASPKVKEFLDNHIKAPESLAKVTDLFTAVKNDPGFEDYAEKIRALLSDPTMDRSVARRDSRR